MSAQIVVVNHIDAVREMLGEILRYHDYDVSVIEMVKRQFNFVTSILPT